ncbi:MAG: hypothetical protein KAT35_04345, partial [Candidatus Aenigmarchaeota archaeon]|nr:hypothetical protein [Candidatus Aenigmarchaeota archaeon]
MEDTGLLGFLSICQGAWATKLVSVALELEIFTRISKGADTVDKISEESGIDVRMLHMITNACRSLGLVTGSGGVIRNSPLAKRFLVRGSREYLGNFTSLIGENYYEVWRGLKNVVLTGNPVRDDRVVRLSDPKYAEAYIRSMHDISAGAAERLAGSLNLAGRKSLLEMNGGLGAYSLALTKKNSGLKATIFDSPFSCDIAEREIKSGSVTTQSGDMEKSSVPSGHDIIMLT